MMKAFGISLCLALLIIGSLAVAGQRCEDCPRDKQGRIDRSDSAKKEFIRQNPLPEKSYRLSASLCVI